MARVYGHWDRFEPRPPEHMINSDLLDCLLWVAELSDSLDPEIVNKLARHRDNTPSFSWKEGSVLRTPEGETTCYDHAYLSDLGEEVKS